MEQKLDSFPMSKFQPSNKAEIRQKLLQLPIKAQQKVRSDADQVLNYNWPSIPVTSYLDFRRNGNRTRMEKYWSDGLSVLKKLIFAEILDNKGNYLDAIVNGSWAMCEESTWVLSAHLPSQKGGAGIPNIDDPIIDLGAGENAAALAWTYYLFKDDFKKISPFLSARIPFEINRRIIKPYMERDDFWWLGFKNEKFVNNWNPWCNYNVTLSALLLENEISASTRSKLILKSMRSVDKFINYYKDDGACEEGPAYWIHAAGKMMEYLTLLKNYSNGKIDLSQTTLIKNMGKYIIDAHIHDAYYINFADSSVRLATDPGLVFRYGLYSNDLALKEFGSYLAYSGSFFDNPTTEYVDAAIQNLMVLDAIQSTKPSTSKATSFWYKGTEMGGGRTHSESDKGFFIAAKGGYNDESHNHNDIGSFMLFHEGKPLLVDIGVETYSSKTFGSQRYQIWTMQSEFHNLPIINGFAQPYGRKYKATDVVFTNSKMSVKMQFDFVNAYPNEASIRFWKRSYHLKRTRFPEFEIEDKYSLTAIKGSNVQHFISVEKPKLDTDGAIILKEMKDKKIWMFYPKGRFEFKMEELPLTDSRLISAWQHDKLYRIILIDQKKSLRSQYQFKISEKSN